MSYYTQPGAASYGLAVIFVIPALIIGYAIFYIIMSLYIGICGLIDYLTRGFM